MALTPETVAAAATTLLVGSEALSLFPGIRSNGWVQLLLAAARGIAGRR